MRFKAPLLLFLTLGVYSALICQQKTTETLFYKVSLTCPKGDMGTGEMFIRGEQYSWEMNTGGQNIRLVRNSDGVFLIPPSKRFIRKYPSGTSRESPRVCLPGPIGEVQTFIKEVSARKIGQDKIDKTLCDVYSYSDKTTGWRCKLKVQPKTFKPVELVMLGKTPEDTVTVRYLAYRTGLKIPASRFEIPKGITIRPVADRSDGETGPASRPDGR